MQSTSGDQGDTEAATGAEEAIMNAGPWAEYAPAPSEIGAGNESWLDVLSTGFSTFRSAEESYIRPLRNALIPSTTNTTIANQIAP